MQCDNELEGLDPIVYIIGCSVFRDIYCIKIGCSLNPLDRIDSMQVGCPIKYDLVWLSFGGFRLESKLHDMFRKKRIHGEWFVADLPEMIELQKDILGESKIYREAIARTRESRAKNRSIVGAATAMIGIYCEILKGAQHE